MSQIELPEGYDVDALERCRELFFGSLAEPERVTITLTSEFTRLVKETVEDEAYAAAYEQERPMAFALAKTIERSDGTIHLIVFADLFLDDLPYGDPEATFAHEALHVNTTERGEGLSDLRLRHIDEELPTHEFLVGAAGVSGEEYRVERALWAADWRRESDHFSGVERLAKVFYNEVHKACDLYRRTGDITAAAKATLEPFHALATSSAYVAAEIAEAGQDPLTLELEMDEDLNELVFGSEWRRVLAALQRFPAADVETPRAELDAIAFDLARSLETWLEEIGFRIKQNGSEFFFEALAPGSGLRRNSSSTTIEP